MAAGRSRAIQHERHALPLLIDSLSRLRQRHLTFTRARARQQSSVLLCVRSRSDVAREHCWRSLPGVLHRPRQTNAHTPYRSPSRRTVCSIVSGISRRHGGTEKDLGEFCQMNPTQGARLFDWCNGPDPFGTLQWRSDFVRSQTLIGGSLFVGRSFPCGVFAGSGKTFASRWLPSGTLSLVCFLLRNFRPGDVTIQGVGRA